MMEMEVETEVSMIIDAIGSPVSSRLVSSRLFVFTSFDRHVLALSLFHELMRQQRAIDNRHRLIDH